jgi:hypothetical protein
MNSLTCRKYGYYMDTSIYYMQTVIKKIHKMLFFVFFVVAPFSLADGLNKGINIYLFQQKILKIQFSYTITRYLP